MLLLWKTTKSVDLFQPARRLYLSLAPEIPAALTASRFSSGKKDRIRNIVVRKNSCASPKRHPLRKQCDFLIANTGNAAQESYDSA